MKSLNSNDPDTITVNATATLTEGVGAQFDLIVDGVDIGSATAGVNPQAYVFRASLAPNQAHDVQVVYTNDAVINGQDRNLLLQSIVVDGETLAANDNSEVYRTIYGNVLPGDGHMSWDGTADFTLAAGSLPASPPAYYVAVNGNDTTGDGSAVSPFASLDRAQSAMEHSSVHTTYVEGGTYNLSNSLMLTAADNGVSFISAPGQHAVLDGAGAGLANLMTLNGAQNVTLQGLTFENTASGYFNGAVALVNATGNHIVGNLFTNNDRGVLLTASGGNVISGNEFDNSITAGINAGAASNNNTIDSNLINGTRFFGTGTGSAGVWITGGSNNAITHNTIENTAGAGIALANWNTDPANLNVGNTISYNSVINADSSPLANDSGGIYVDGRAGIDTRMTISNNAISLASSPTTGVDVGIYLDDWTSGATVTGNIVTGGNFGFLIHGGQNNTLSNNIFDLGTRSAPNIGVGLIQSDAGGPFTSMTGNMISGNVVYSTATQPSNVYVTYGGTATVSDNLYYNTNGQPMSIGGPAQDGSAGWGDPQFVDAAAGNYAMGAGSAALAMGFRPINQSAIGLAPTTPHWY